MIASLPKTRTPRKIKRVKSRARPLRVKAVPTQTPVDRAALRAAYLPFLVSVVRDLEARGKIVNINGVLTVPNFKP